MKRRKDGLLQQELPRDLTGGKRKVIYGRTKADIARKIKAYEITAEKGKAFESVAEAWWEEAEPALAVNSRKNYKPAYERAKARFTGQAIQSIQPKDINQFIRDFVSERHAAEKTAKTQLMVVNLICRYAVQMGYINANPARDLTVPKGLEHNTRSAPTSETIAKIKAGVSLPFGLFAFMAMYTGARRGELLALTYEDIDREKKTIRIDKSLYYEYGKAKTKSPKTEKGKRVVPLLDKLAEQLPEGSGLIFQEKGQYITEGRFIMLWRDYLKAAGIESLTPHELRHAYATMLYENNVNVATAQELLGHAQYSTTMDIYTTIREKQMEKERSALLGVDIQ